MAKVKFIRNYLSTMLLTYPTSDVGMVHEQGFPKSLNTNDLCGRAALSR